jgi:hypothetical protein
MDEQSKNKGRGKGNRNRLTMETKQQLSEFALEELQKLWKHFPALETDKKVRALLKFAPYFLSKGSATKEEVELQAILFEVLLPHYKRMGTYLNHIPVEDRFEVLVQFLKLFTPEQAKQIGDAIAGKKL